MNRHAIQQNDVGVNCFVTVGDVDAALHHFCQALSAKLSAEKLLSERLSSDSMVPSLHDFAPPEADGTNLDSSVPDQRNLTPVPADTGISRHFESNSSNAKDFVPYLYCRPFSVVCRGVAADLTTYSVSPSVDSYSGADVASTDSVVTSLVIIFNVALMHHMKDRASMKAYEIYQIAITLLWSLPPPEDSESLLLYVAVLNNYGAWCFDNHEFVSMMACFEEMKNMIDDACDDDVFLKLHETVKFGIFTNLRVSLDDSFCRVLL